MTSEVMPQANPVMIVATAQMMLSTVNTKRGPYLSLSQPPNICMAA